MGNLSDTDREKAEKELARRKSNAKTIRQAGRAAGVRRDENIVSAYYNAMDVVQSGHAGDFRKGKSVGEWFFTVFYSAYASVKRAAPFIAMVSILLGSTICFFAKRNKMVFRRALFVFVLGVPFVLVLVVFGIGSMTTVFG